MESNPNLKIIEEGDQVYLEGDFSPKSSNTETRDHGDAKAKLWFQLSPHLNFDGSPVSLDTDYFGKKRDLIKSHIGTLRAEVL